MTDIELESSLEEIVQYGRLIQLGQNNVLECKKLLWANGLVFRDSKPAITTKLHEEIFKVFIAFGNRKVKRLYVPYIERKEVYMDLDYIPNVTCGAYQWKGSFAKGYDLIQPAIKKNGQFRLLCDRNGGQVQIFAGVCNDKGTIHTTQNSLKWTTTSGGIDGFPDSSVLLWAKHLHRWVEISILGSIHELRKIPTQPGELISASNILEDHSLIHSNGITFLWRTGSPKNPVDNCELFRDRICPITFEPILISNLTKPFESPSKFNLSTFLFGPKGSRQKNEQLLSERPWYFTGCGYYSLNLDMYSHF